ncbi:MAG: insulinase family protein [Muribaculaceae bacterium]|nr:insulinase family protein [Muribaculaceae bacterium]
MFKKFFSMALLGLSALVASAQTPLPLDPAVKHGTLPNGLNYYIMHNSEPKERVNFYIAQKVGSTLETPEQLGLAHFLEHMAFNGTTNFPGKAMLNYLQSKGIRFGNDINAYTSFDETVYNIDNVPSTDAALIDSVLLVLHDWSGSILLEEDEINAERGVIEEEWRMRNNAMNRMFEGLLQVAFEEYQYQQTPIGKMEVVRNFPPQDLRDYYHKWYRPDQQGIVIVGDIDVNSMEQKVINLFSTIKMPENPAERTYASVSDNKEPIYYSFADKEIQFPMALVMFKSDPFPKEYRNTVEYFAQNNVILSIFCQMINNRLDEYSKKAECKYAQASVDFGNFMVAKTKDAFEIQVIGKSSDDMKAAFDEAMAIVARACKTGFTPSEVTRARDQLLADFEKAYNERNNTNNSTLARKIIRHFIDNDPVPGIEKEYEVAQMMLTAIPVDAYNMLGAEILSDENQVIAISLPKTDTMTMITKEEMVGSVSNAIHSEYEPYVDEVITDPLIEKLPAAGKVVSEADGLWGAKEITLSNGVKVLVKTTDFKQDEVQFMAYSKGGKASYPASEAADVLLLDDVFEVAKMGNFDHVKLEKYLAGKKVNLGYQLGTKANILQGTTTVKDLPTLMELIYSSFAQLNPDADAYNVEMEKAKSFLARQDKDQNRVLNELVLNTSYGNNPMFQMPSVKLIDAANYDKSFAILKQALANPADFTFVFVGNVTPEALKPMLEQYVASLPTSKTQSDVKDVTSVSLVDGNVKEFKTMPMGVPSTMVYVTAHGNNIENNIASSVKMNILGQILSNIYTDTLREEEGGTYSPYAFGQLNTWTGSWMLTYVFQTNDAMQAKLIERANAEMLKLLANGTDAVNFNKVKEATLKQYDIRVRTNGYWLNNYFLNGFGFDQVTDNQAAIANLTLEEFNAFIKNLYDGKNHIEVVLQGVAE